MRTRQFVGGFEARTVRRQPLSICADCPFGRDAIPGWLGDADAEEWLRMLHGETRIECHTRLLPGGGGVQCVGAAVYRANVSKRPRDPQQLRRPADRRRVFASPAEFMTHHHGAMTAMPRSPREQHTRDEWIRRIDDLIDAFPNELFIELLEEMEDRAKTAREARLEELDES